MAQGIGDRFQQETKYRRGELPGGQLDWANKPDTYKTYPQATRLRLPVPRLNGGRPLWTVIRQRRSVRRYQAGQVSVEQLSQLLWASQGLTEQRSGFGFRAAPSAGGLHPIETYLAIHAVAGLEAGLYHYAPQDHALEQLISGDLRLATARAALDQRIAHDADLVFVWSALLARSKWKYKERAYRYVYLDAGHIAQNLALAAVSLGLGTCQIAALYDDEANQLLGLDGTTESVIYMSAVGAEASALGAHRAQSEGGR